MLPCRALDSQMKVVRLRLSNLSFLNESALLAGLQKSLQRYGDILDVGILLEPTTGTYMCTGYATLNTVPHKTLQVFCFFSFFACHQVLGTTIGSMLYLI